MRSRVFTTLFWGFSPPLVSETRSRGGPRARQPAFRRHSLALELANVSSQWTVPDGQWGVEAQRPWQPQNCPVCLPRAHRGRFKYPGSKCTPDVLKVSMSDQRFGVFSPRHSLHLLINHLLIQRDFIWSLRLWFFSGLFEGKVAFNQLILLFICPQIIRSWNFKLLTCQRHSTASPVAFPVYFYWRLFQDNNEGKQTWPSFKNSIYLQHLKLIIII